MPLHHASRPSYNNPVDDLDEGDNAEAEEEAKESSKRGNEVHRAHPDAPLEFLRDHVLSQWRDALFTHDSFFAKKYVNNSNVLLPGVVEVHL